MSIIVQHSKNFAVIYQAGYIVLIFFVLACNDKKQEKDILNCYTPNNNGIMQIDSMLKTIPQRQDTSCAGMVWIDGGEFLMDATKEDIQKLKRK
jgi:formylglycine-generating enzyme required for sulfatase activity